MEWWYYLPVVFYVLWVFLFGLGVGSFLNVLIARLPYDKSIIWPSSRCMSCLRPIKLLDNLPILGYLRLRGKCRFCGQTFSSRYLWVELGTGLAFVALYTVEVLTSSSLFASQWHYMPGLKFGNVAFNLPPLKVWVFFAHHAFLLSILIAAALIDLEHRIIPPVLTYTGTIIGILASTLLPWPWPNGLETLPLLPQFPLPAATNWGDIRLAGRIPTGVMPYPFAGPPPDWCPPGSTLLGLLNGLIGAAAGMIVGRGIKWGFEVGFGQEALGLGDADLLMCIGAFLGWQVAVLALPVGAFVALAVILPLIVWRLIRRRKVRTDLPFGPGIAAGAVFTWIFWPWIGELVRFPSFDWMASGVVAVVVGVGLLAAGLILRRRREV
ncbi:MAG TPA: prepilin peptidase [Fimbriiglobus sp.]|jgi:leader peptidase (prepilin peptidase)/N-methyltransferase